ncbi:signal peptide peptidase SppA [Saccharopolyspora kobensis]|uniref:Signal peptide peptidase SppA n=1 Tax=Saccharopolyspora kobensis TaxID=146035 RepID=A0A1H6DG48_9PSEU|nr:S49 family peptidase [Saccharopolyspora kobensis]SEG84328.1 signal peptide peptidase SppA [Saccharopolyspora kobensis]SFD28687.1 signal peptide peptidase SppA [Saccharopolyspora kobensis]
MSEKAPQKFTDLLSGKLSAKLPGKLAERAERGPVVAVVKLHGVITSTPSPMSRPTISTQTAESALTRAFGHDRLAGVVLAVNSPGGAPTQSALVADRIRELAAEKDVPVLAYCEDVAASGGYWLACAADEIYAHPTSIVGSVGVVSASFGLTGLIEKLGVERRVYTAGEHKVRLDPFRPEKEEDVQWLRGLQGELHEQFRDWVRKRRGSKLQSSDDDLFSGEVWTGAKAAELGLVDGVGSLREIVKEKFPDAHLHIVEQRKPLLARLGMSSSVRLGGSPADAVLSTVEALEHRAMWNRFGL